MFHCQQVMIILQKGEDLIGNNSAGKYLGGKCANKAWTEGACRAGAGAGAGGVVARLDFLVMQAGAGIELLGLSTNTGRQWWAGREIRQAVSRSDWFRTEAGAGHIIVSQLSLPATCHLRLT